jgi:CubicO group peptidase (beta-lactamase class C family)/D-alanyl-D-alanine dipeptidase
MLSFLALTALLRWSVADDIPAQPEYAPVAAALSPFIREQMEDKQIPAISIALVDNQQIVWSAGFGYARSNVLASADTIYRVGSVSKLFTDIAIMQLVEKGLLDLDKPIVEYVSTLHPRDPFGRPITLRQVMAHHAGFCREPPVGNYFDPTNPSLAATVASLNKTELVHEPGTREKYSNGGIALLGYVLEVMKDRPYARYIEEEVLKPLGLTNSSFTRTPFIETNLADGLMWTLHGRTFKAPIFELGIAPAGCMYSSVTELGRFCSVLFAGGRAGEKQVLQPASLEQMMTVQFAPPGRTNGFGLGFSMHTLGGERAAGHNGAIYGFSTHFTALIGPKLGVVVIASKDFVNTVTDVIGVKALAAMVAVKNRSPMPELPRSKAVDPDLAKALEGRFTNETRAFEISEQSGALSLLWESGGYQQTLRQWKDSLVTDGPLGYGMMITVDSNRNRIRIGPVEYARGPFVGKPEAVPDRWRGLVGEYGWDHDVLYILERKGKLWALIEWFEFNPLEEISENVFRFPARGLYSHEKLTFTRNGSGRATEVVAANVRFKRRAVGPESGSQMQLSPVRPVSEIRTEALRAKPPAESGEFRQPDLVEIARLDPSIKLDVRYAREDNFLGTPFYTEPRAFLQKPAAEALIRAHKKLKERGYGLMVFDGYRPWYVTKIFWDATPDQHKFLVADPSKGSRHNRGAAVDLTLFDLKTGKAVEMVGTYDEASDRTYPNYPGGTSLQRWHRELLHDVMEAEGFSVYPEEWWHFDYNDWRFYPIMNTAFEDFTN